MKHAPMNWSSVKFVAQRVSRTGLLSVIFALLAPAGMHALPVTIQSFESDAIPTWLNPGECSSLSLDPRRSQHGGQSLLWSWDAPSHLTITPDAPGMERSQHVREFRVWVYSEEVGGRLEVEAGRFDALGNPDSNSLKLDFELNFIGWRSLWLKFREDGNYMAGIMPDGPLDPINAIRFVVAGREQGRLFLDLMEVSKGWINHGRLGSLQQPWVKNDPRQRHNFPWVGYPFRLTQSQIEEVPYSDEQFEIVEERLDKMFSEPMGRLGKALRGAEAVEAAVTFEEGRVRGPGIYSHIVERYYRLKGFGGLHASDVNGALWWYAKQFTDTGDSVWMDKYVALLDYHAEKGYVDGSAVMNLVFEAKNAYNYIGALQVMKPYLDGDRIQRSVDFLRWISGVNNLYNPEAPRIDCDKMLGDMRTMLMVLHLQPSSTKEERRSKWASLYRFAELIEKAMQPSRIEEGG